MAQSEIKVHSAYLTSKDKLDDRFLFAGKVEKPEVDGFFFYIIEILSPWFPSSKVKKEIMAVLEHVNLEDANEISFENTIVKINETLDKLTQTGEKEWIGNLNALIGLVSGNDLFIAQTGTIAGYIFRKGNISAITEKNILASAPLPINTFTDITNGKIAKNDRLIFGNTELYNHLSLDRLRNLSENKSSKEAIIEISRFFKKLKNTGVNAILIEANDLDEIENRVLDELPEVVYVDQAEETFLTKAKKTLRPYYEKGKVYGQKLSKHGKKTHHYLKEKYKEKYGSKTRELSGAEMEKCPLLDQKLGAKPQEVEGFSKMKLKVKPYSQKTKSFLNFLQKVYSILAVLFKKSLMPQNRKYLYAVLIVIVLFFGYSKIKHNNEDKSRRTEEQNVANAYDDAKNMYAKAKDDLTLGKNEGLDELVQALALTDKAATKDATKEKALLLASDIKKTLDQKTGTIRTFDPKALFDFNNTINVATLVGTEVYAINNDGKIFSADTRDKEVALVSSIGKSSGEAIDVSYSKSNSLLFIGTGNQKMLTFDITSKTFKAEKNADTDTWETAKAIATYVSNIYLLDSTNGEVWKHTESATGYSKGVAYVDTRKVSLKDAVDFAIDGDIYVLQTDSTVAKFVKGAYDSTFSIKDLPAPYEKVESPAQIFTDTDSSYIYILDKKLNRIIRFSREGEFNHQYILDGITIDKFMVNSKLQKMWALSGSKVYEITL